LDQSLLTITSLQEDPTIQQLEAKTWQLQQAYDNVRGTSQMITLTQHLTGMNEVEAVKEQVDVAHQKEAMLKARIQPWLKEAFLVTAKIGEKLTQM